MEFDADRFRREERQRRLESGKRIEERRAALLDILRAAGVKNVFASYSGYADSGGTEYVRMTGAGGEDDAIRADRLPEGAMDSLEGLVWDAVTHLHEGFENDSGGQGEFFWNTVSDSVSIEHGDNVMETVTSDHADIRFAEDPESGRDASPAPSGQDF